jgi:hypothetical protein
MLARWGFAALAGGAARPGTEGNEPPRQCHRLPPSAGASVVDCVARSHTIDHVREGADLWGQEPHNSARCARGRPRAFRTAATASLPRCLGRAVPRSAYDRRPAWAVSRRNRRANAGVS